MKIIGLIIAIVLYAIPLVLLENLFRKEIEKLKSEIDHAQNRVHYVENDLNRHKRLNDDQYRQFQMLVHLLDMKVETDWRGRTTIEKLTESEKTAKELRQQADELEREEKCLND